MTNTHFFVLASYRNGTQPMAADSEYRLFLHRLHICTESEFLDEGRGASGGIKFSAKFLKELTNEKAFAFLLVNIY